MVGLHWEKGEEGGEKGETHEITRCCTISRYPTSVALVPSLSPLLGFLAFLSPHAIFFCSLPFLFGLLHVNVYRLGCRWKEMGNEAALSPCTHAHILRTFSRNATQYNVFGGWLVLPSYGRKLISFDQVLPGPGIYYYYYIHTLFTR